MRGNGLLLFLTTGQRLMRWGRAVPDSLFPSTSQATPPIASGNSPQTSQTLRGPVFAHPLVNRPGLDRWSSAKRNATERTVSAGPWAFCGSCRGVRFPQYPLVKASLQQILYRKRDAAVRFSLQK